MDPRAVEAPSHGSLAPKLRRFQMDPRAVEARVREHQRPRTNRFRWTLVRLKRHLTCPQHARRRVSDGPSSSSLSRPRLVSLDWKSTISAVAVPTTKKGPSGTRSRSVRGWGVRSLRVHARNRTPHTDCCDCFRDHVTGTVISRAETHEL